MASKKGFELSLNMIIIAIIAFVFLGVAIKLIMNFAGGIEQEIPKIFPPDDAWWPATRDDPIKLIPSKIDMKVGDDRDVTLQIYNYETVDIECNINFIKDPDKADLNIVYSKTNRPIPVGMVGQWMINVASPKTKPTGVYLYRLDNDCGEFQHQMDYMIGLE